MLLVVLDGPPLVREWPACLAGALMTETVLEATGVTALGTRSDTTQRFKLAELLGRGGMGEVWKAWDRELEMDVALKSLRPNVARDPNVLARFRREAKIARRIKHVNVAQMYDLIELEGVRYLSMECVEGKTLKEILSAKRNLPVHVALGFMKQVCSGVQAAHETGVVHRDLKPHNIMVTRRHGRICILDFGIAREVGNDDLTEIGVILGSPQYLSYEQLCGRPATALSDIYQLGILLHELVTGISPFRAPGAAASTLRAMREIPPDARQHESRVPGFVAEAILRCLSKYPEDRFQSAKELAAHLEACRIEADVPAAETLDVDLSSITLGGAPTALVAVACETQRRLVADRLERIGCIVTQSGDGQRAIEAAWGTKFSLVILSASLPTVDGLTACQILRRSPLASAVPILLVVDPSDGREASARDAGASGVVHSPVNVHALTRSVREILAG